jgi:hypothetical protein
MVVVGVKGERERKRSEAFRRLVVQEIMFWVWG